MGWFKFKKKKQEEEIYVPPVDTKLYILTEVQKSGLVSYLKQHNVEVYFITTSCDKLLTALINEEQTSRVLILDGGFGKFEEKKTMEDIGALVEIAMDIGTVTLFTSNSVLGNLRRQFVRNNKESAEVFELVKKTGAVEILKTLQGYNEVYTLGGAKDVTVGDILSFQGKKLDIEAITVEQPLEVEVKLDTKEVSDSIARYGSVWK